MPDSISPFDRPLTHKSLFNIVCFPLIPLSLYPFTAIDHSSIGHSVVQYALSMRKIKIYLCEEVPAILAGVSGDSSSSSGGGDGGGDGGGGGGGSGGVVGSDKKSTEEEPKSNDDDVGKAGSPDKEVDMFGVISLRTTDSFLRLFRDLSSSSSSSSSSSDGDSSSAVLRGRTRKEFIMAVRNRRAGLDATVWTREVAQTFKAAMLMFPLTAPMTPGTKGAAEMMVKGTGKRKADAPPDVDLTKETVEVGAIDLTVEEDEVEVDEVEEDEVEVEKEKDNKMDHNKKGDNIAGTTRTLENCGTMISCGHVEANLDAGAIQEILNMLTMIRHGHLTPSNVKDDVGEWSSGRFSFIFPCNCVQSLEEAALM